MTKQTKEPKEEKTQTLEDYWKEDAARVNKMASDVQKSRTSIQTGEGEWEPLNDDGTLKEVKEK